jgi:hypothetical protein
MDECAGLVPIVMLFAGLSSAYDHPVVAAHLIGVPSAFRGFLILNSLILFVSSVTLEMFRRRLTVVLTPKARFGLAPRHRSAAFWLGRSASGRRSSHRESI